MNIRSKNKTKHNKKKSGRRGPKYWVLAVGTMGVLVAYTVGNSRAVSVACLREERSIPAAISSMIETQTQTRRFNIAAGPLEAVLSEFQKVTGLQLVFANEDIRAVQSQGVTGTYTDQQALAQLLSGTGINYRFTKSDTVALELKGPDESVTIEQPAPQVSSAKYTEPLRDIPQTITVIPRGVIEEQGATTLRDVLRNVSGLTIAAGEGGVPAGDNLTLRGFSARNDIFIDGARDISPQSRDPFNLEQVEVAKGPSSSFTGRGSTGGSINLVSKSPLLERLFSGTLNFGSDQTRRVTTDLNIPLKRFGLGERTSFRLNTLFHQSDVAGRNVVENERWGVAPSLAFGVGTNTRLTFNYFKLKQDNIPDYGIPWVTATNNAIAAFRDRPAPVPRDTFYGLRNIDHENLNSDVATFKFERDFGDSITLHNQLRYSKSTRESITTAPRFLNDNSTVLTRGARSWITKDEIWDNQTDLSGRLTTGPIQHSIVAGIALTNENNTRQNRTVTSPNTTLLNPNPNDPFTGTIVPIAGIGDITGRSLSLYIFDTAKIGSKWEVIAGVRWDRFDVDGFAAATATAARASVSRADQITSGRLGVVYKPRQNGSIYAAVGSSANPSLEGLSYQTANTFIEPEKTYNFEIGTKWDLFRDRLLLNTAVFRVDKTNARTTPDNPGEPAQVLEGRQRVSGVEIGAMGSITRELRLFAAYTFLDSEIVRSNVVAPITEVGKELQNTPKNSLSLWTTYQLPWRFSVGGGARYTGRRFGNNTNTRFVDGYWLFDATVAYPIAEKIDLRLNLYNLADKYYFDRLGGGHLVPGPGRSVSLGAGFRF